jgi:hypothetical protein
VLVKNADTQSSCPPPDLPPSLWEQGLNICILKKCLL